MKRSVIKAAMTGQCDKITFHKDGTITAKWSYYYRFEKTPEGYVEKIQRMFPNARIIDKGDHMHSFVGGARTGGAQDSYMWVRFEVT
jgi:hypothetical protein